MRKVFTGVLIVFGLVAVAILCLFFGNPYGYIKNGKRIKEYKTNMKDVDFHLFNESKVMYSFKDGSYRRRYTYKTQELAYFDISCSYKECTDSYEFDFIEGTNFLSILGNKIVSDKFIGTSDLENEYGIILLEPIDTLDNLYEYKDKLLKNEDVYNLPIFKLTFQITVDSFESDKIYNSFFNIDNYLKEWNYSPVYLEGTVYLEDGETNIVISEVTSDKLTTKNKFMNYVKSINNKTFKIVDESGICAQALEKFYSDKENDYYFSCIKSSMVYVEFNTGKKYTVKEALKKNLITIEDVLNSSVSVYVYPKEVSD